MRTADYLMKTFGLDPEETDNINETSLMKVSKGGNVNAAKLLQKATQRDFSENYKNRSPTLLFACNSMPEAIDKTVFLLACKNGFYEVVKSLLEIDCYRLANDKSAMLGLHLSCENGHTSTAEYLMKELELDFKGIDDMNETPLMKACRGGHAVTAEMLLKAGKWNLHAKNKHGENALHLACKNRHGAKVAHCLISSGLISDELDYNGRTPLMNACSSGLLLIVRLLAESDEFSLNQKNRMGQSLLHLACISGHDDVSQFLIERGAITDERDEMGYTPLARACQNGLLVAVKYLVKMGHSVSWKCQFNSSSLLHLTCDKIGHVQIIQCLVQSGADFDERDNYDETPLMLASRRGFISSVKFFCSIGSSLVAMSKSGLSPLHYACKYGHTSVANFMIGKYIEQDVCLNKPDKINKTSLVYAYENGMLSVVQQLEARGCSLHVDDALLTSACIRGSTATLNHVFKRHTSVVWDVWKYFSKACEKKRVDVAVFLIKLFSKLLVEGGRDALFIACKQNSLCVADHLIKLGCSVNHKTSNGESLLHFACEKGHVGIVHLFLDAGAAANEVDKAGETVLRAACKKNLLSVVARLINSGCLLKEKRKKEETLLHVAGGRDVAQFLVREADFMLNAIDSNGNTPLMAACQREHFKVANWLIENGSSVNQKNEFAESPFSWFLEHCWTSINPFGIFDGLTVERFVLAGADVSSKSKRSKVNVLHVVARTVFQNGEKACRFFLDKGADPDAQDKSGKVPYEYADGNKRKILREAWAKRRYSKLEELGESKPSKIKVCLIGKVGAGKTTLMNSLRRMQSEEASSVSLQVQSSDPKRTAGIDIITAAIDEAGDVVFCDFAGQPNFHKTHSLFFSESTTIYLLVVDVTNSKQEIYLSSLYWLSLTKCSIGSSTNNSIVLIGSRGDKTTDGSMILRQLRTSLASKFEKFFDVFLESFILDCRVSTSVEMQKLRRVISDLKAKRIEEAPCTFTLVDDLQFILLPVLRDISKKLRPLEALEELNLLPKFMRVRKRESNTSCLEIIDDKNERLNDFPSFGKQIKAVHCRQFVSRDFFCLLIDENFFRGLDKDTLYQFVQFLHGIGEIIEFGDNIILDPPWLCNNVIGPLMSPETFPVCLEGVDDGTVSSKRIEKAICQFNKQQRDFPLEVIMELLCSLEICYVVPSEENVYRFPALILKRRRDEFWIEDEDVIVYVGRRLQCKDETDIIVPGTIPFLQTRSVVCLDPSPQIWKDGMVLEKRIDEMTTIEGLIELQETAKAIDVVARGPANSEAECLDFVKEMLDMVRKVLDDRSPGTIIDCELCLSTSALKKLVEHPPAHKPSLIEIAKSKDSPVSTTRKIERYTDTLRDLLIVPSDHYCLLPRKVKVGLQEALNFCKQSLCLLGKELGLKASEVIGCKDPERLLRIWNSRRDALVSKLVHCLRKCRSLVALHIMHRDTPFVQLSDDEAAAAEKAFESTFCAAMDDSKSLPLEGDQEVEERHIDYLKEEVIDSDGVLNNFIRHLLGWSFTRAKQFLNNSKDQTIAMKFFDAVMQWRDREGLNATIGKLLEAFEKVGKKGAALKLLSRLN
ncbi:death-associated protein kinase 1-like isoform X2 [Oscarella lobularis]|uniref:death-associated protein kinase 1-like isoform X2 n=1 Tax=Oscarella lobularis TaxID=121494 RepID=UPI00331325D0